MQQLLQLKPRDEPQDSFVSTDHLFDPDMLSENSGQVNELRDLFSFLFKPSFLLELKEETKSLNITLDEQEKKLILNLKKKTKSKSLAKKGQTYTLRKELEMTSLTLVYNYQPSYVTLNELQPVLPMQPMTDLVKPIEITRPQVMLKPELPIKPILINDPDDITIVLPLPDYTDNLLGELPTRPYEEKFRPFNGFDTYSEETLSDSEDYRVGPEKFKKPEDLVQKYQPGLTVQTPMQNQIKEVKMTKYDGDRFEDGCHVCQKIGMRTTGWTTVYDSLKQSGIPFKETYSKEFDCIYIPEMNGIPEGSHYWEAKVNGKYVETSFEKALVPPEASVDFVLKTAEPGVCGTNK